MRGGSARADSRAHDRADSAPNGSAHDCSAASAGAQYGKVSLYFRAGDNVPFALGVGVGALRIDDLSMHVVAGTVGQDEFIGTEVEGGAAVQTARGGGEYDSPVQLRTLRHNHFAVARDVLGDLPTERCTRSGGVGVDILKHANPEDCSFG